MSSSNLISYVGLAFVYALAASLFLLGVSGLLRRRFCWNWLPLALATLFFIFLTQHPFPSRENVSCPVPFTSPQFKPFDFLNFLRAYGPNWYKSTMFLSMGMNLAICSVIGLMLARHTSKIWHALAFGLILPFAIELTQLTGIWGLYPCPYRQFDVDDLILNLAGILIGFLLGRRLGITPRRS